jgi:predicted Zn-dependent protease with MMP-like domain
VHDVRKDRLLRLVAEQARHCAWTRERPSDHSLSRARRGLELVLRRRGRFQVRAAVVDNGLLDPAGQFEEYAQDALDSLPPDLRTQMSNVEIVVEDEPPPGEHLLGLYQGVPLTRRGSHYGGVLPDKITIYRGPLVRLYGQDAESLRREVRRVVLHEVAHHFGISDERLIEIDRY